jgi:cytochrome b involved in lipid metabolism
MKNKEIVFLTTVVALIGGGVLYVSINKNQTTMVVKNTNTTNQISPKTTTSNTKNTASKTTTITPKPNTIPSYTLSEVSTHNNQTSCWTVVDGKIYDITDFISSHPAGVSKIMRGCGVDATNMYNNVGAHDISKLSNSFVGNLK